MEKEIDCPWCLERYYEESDNKEGVRKCVRCHKYFAFFRHEEVIYTTEKIEKVRS